MKLTSLENMWGAAVFEYVWTYRTLSPEKQDAKRHRCLLGGLAFTVMSIIAFFAIHFWLETAIAIGFVRLLEVSSLTAAIFSLMFSFELGMDLILFCLVWLNMKREQILG